MSEKIKIIRPQEGFQEKFVRTNVDFCVGGGILGGGKENPLYTKVLTPQGWVRMGDLKVGDLVCTPFGNATPILQIFEHKDKEIYELETSDGRKSRCGLEHLWSFRTRKQIHKYRNHTIHHKNLTTENTSYLIKRLNKGQSLYIPIPKAQEFSEKDFVIHPYVLGVLIGDGCISQGIKSTSFTISNSEIDVIEKVKILSNADRVYYCPSNYNKVVFTKNAQKYSDYIKSVKLDTYSYNKFIPNEYLWGSIEQRKQLLYGLMDTDGCVEDGNRFSFSTTSEQLANDFVYLCRSLGYIATINIDNRKDKYTSNVAYGINIHTDDIIFSSEKHIKRFNKNKEIYNRKYGRTNDHVRIKSIKKVDKCDARCIFIKDYLHLYIIDDFTTTHNSFAACLSVAEPSQDGRFRALFLRNNLGDAKASGGLLDTFREIYGDAIDVVESGDPRVTFKNSGAKIDVTHVADQSRDKVLQRFKGRQYDFIYFDEGTGFTWECFTAIYTRNRGTSSWTGKVRMTTNPDKNHWLRKFLNWYIGVDGFIIPEREGVVRYFFINGERVENVVWGDTKKEVYQKCKITIDRLLNKVNGNTGTATYEDIIKSFTFYLGRMAENKAMTGNNSGYAGSVAVMGGRNAQQLLEGNWNVSPEEDEDAPITMSMANSVLMNDPQINGDKWVTCDLADTGTDNFLAIAWDGFHIIDVLVLGQTTPKMNAERLEIFAASHNISNSHIIYDAIRGTYINDYIPDAQPFVSYRQPMGLYGRMAYNLKTECYMRFVEAVKRGYISIDEKVAKRVYEHQKIKDNILISDEFVEECAVIRFKDMPSGKKQLFSKKEMNQHLGKNRSMDLCDPIAMRFYPCLAFPYGEELEKTAKAFIAEEDNDTYYRRENIYNDNFWA